MTWQPWEDFKTTEIAYELPIEAPPCAKCRFWAPRRKYEIMDKRGGTAFTGVILCHAASMYPDFSCFKEIPKPETECLNECRSPAKAGATITERSTKSLGSLGTQAPHRRE